MGKRRRSREFALQVLYQFEILKQDPNKVLSTAKEHFLSKESDYEFSERIVLGIQKYINEIDLLIKRYSKHWRLDRMTIIDRNILRMALFELLYCEDIPPKVTLNEAINLGKKYGTEDSGSFINGILDRIQKEVIRKPI